MALLRDSSPDISLYHFLISRTDCRPNLNTVKPFPIHIQVNSSLSNKNGSIHKSSYVFSPFHLKYARTRYGLQQTVGRAVDLE
jgi:hypothetical protein